MSDHPFSGDELANCRIIEVHIDAISQLFNSMDPSPFHKKDLDPAAAEYIVTSAQNFSTRESIGLVLYLDQAAGVSDDGRIVGDAVREYFARESEYARRRFHRLLHRGWVSLAIGSAFLAGALVASTFLTKLVADSLRPLVREGFLIGGWVAMWRPLEIFLYDWWPVAGERKLHDRLSRMAVRIVYMGVQGRAEVDNRG